MRIDSLSQKRIIVEGRINGKPGSFLIDTGASIGLIAKDRTKQYGLIQGRRYLGTLTGASGNEINARFMCDTQMELVGKPVSQFILSDISGIRESIRRETGYEILGIIGLSQMRTMGMRIDTMDNHIEI